MVINTRSTTASNVDDAVGQEDSTPVASVPGEETVGDSVLQVSTETVSVPVVEDLATMPPEDEVATASASEKPAGTVVGDDSLLGYLQLVGSLEKNVSRSDDQSAALSSSNVSVQHRKRAVDVENSFVQGLSAIGESYA